MQGAALGATLLTLLAPSLARPSGRSGPQDIKSIVLELEKLLSDIFDAMPCLRPVLGGPLSEYWYAVHLDASRVQHRMIDERRALTAKALRYNNDRSQMLFGQK